MSDRALGNPHRPTPPLDFGHGVDKQESALAHRLAKIEEQLREVELQVRTTNGRVTATEAQVARVDARANRSVTRKDAGLVGGAIGAAAVVVAWIWRIIQVGIGKP